MVVGVEKSLNLSSSFQVGLLDHGGIVLMGRLPSFTTEHIELTYEETLILRGILNNRWHPDGD